MYNRDLSGRWIALKMSVVLVLLAGLLPVLADLHGTANSPGQRADGVQRWLMFGLAYKFQDR